MSKNSVEGSKKLGSIMYEMKKMVNKVRQRVQVKYTAPYAIYVHEDLTKRHPVGQAKFLEEAVRRKEDAAKALMTQLAKAGENLETILRRAAELVLAESQLLVPVDTGFLKSTGEVVVMDHIEHRTWK